MTGFVAVSPVKQLSFQNWVFALSKNGQTYSIPYPPKDSKRWKEWAISFIRSNNKLLKTAPFPTSLEKDPEKAWRTWATGFIRSQL